jgi:NAD(P)-dependent dehydrogenase (short-subunit alcohol dehydrogenase family)
MSEQAKSRRIAAITGAAGGIGGALAAGFAAAGWQVLAIDRVAPAPPPSGVAALSLDITDADAVRAWGEGLHQLDLLINAAGIIRRGDELDPEVFAHVVDVNLNGAMRMCAAARPALAAAGGGAIINIASMLSLFGGPLVPGYTAAKSGIAGLTRSLAVAWAGDGIRVNAIAPGWIETPMTRALRDDEARSRTILARTPMGRWGRPEDLVGPALFLAGEGAGFVTGAMLAVDGGYAAA